LDESRHAAIKASVVEAMQEQMKDFYVEREKHYQHHQFIDGLMEYSRCWKSTCMKAIAHAVIGAIIALVVWGYIAWGGKVFQAK